MAYKELILESIQREIAVVKHLHGKIPAGMEHYRPTFGQRSILELMRYLAYTGASGVAYAVNGNGDAVKPLRDAAQNLTLAEIPAALDRQATMVKELFAGINEADALKKEVTVPWGKTATTAQWLLDLPLKWLTGYKMQLFLYLKQAGRAELATANLWRGEEPKPK
ncbi:MAG: hypothetical protein IT462_16180 [Planctomycetes bacterium]|nr:hypothetical protein [Planctomycetota bacterium]